MTSTCIDNDSDGFSDSICGGRDCDDTDSAINPWAYEGPYGDPTCSDGTDNNCNGTLDELEPGCRECHDVDGDGYRRECEPLDCDDDPGDDPALCTTCVCGVDPDCGHCAVCVHPGAQELRNMVDDDCDGQIDEGCFVGLIL